MYLKNDKLIVSVGKITAHSHVDTKPAFVLDPDAITGWTDGVSTRRDITQRPLAWGDFAEKAYKGSRVITVTGSAIANTPQELHAMRDIFMGNLSHGEFEEMSVTNLSGTRYAWVSVEGPTAWLQKSDTVAVWKLELYADDPRIYGVRKRVTISESSVTGGLDYPVDYMVDYGLSTVGQLANISIANNGNTDAYPVFTIKGDFYSGFSIANGQGKSVVFTGITTLAAPVEIDMLAGTAVQNGIDKSSFFTRREFFSIPPLKAIQPSFSPLATGSGWCDIMYRDTWI